MRHITLTASVNALPAPSWEETKARIAAARARFGKTAAAKMQVACALRAFHRGGQYEADYRRDYEPSRSLTDDGSPERLSSTIANGQPTLCEADEEHTRFTYRYRADRTSCSKFAMRRSTKPI